MREPGYSQRKAVERIWDKMAQYMFLLSVYPLILYAVILQARVTHGAFSPVLIGLSVTSGAVVIGVGVFKIWRLLAASLCLRLGYAGEVAVGQALNQLMLQGYHVFHDVPFDGFNVDHVVIGPGGVFVVETKLRTKRTMADRHTETHKVRFDGRALYFSDCPTVPQHRALNQARAEAQTVAKWLTRKTGMPVATRAVLALPGWWIDGDNQQGEVWVYSHNQLYALPPKRDKPVMAAQQLRRCVAAVEERCARDDLAPQVLLPKNNPLFQES